MVVLQEHVGINISTRRPVSLKQDRIFLDGKHVGYVGWQPGAPINLVVRDLSPSTMESIRTAVAEKLGAGDRKLVIPPEIPEEFLQSQTENEYDADA